MKTESKILNCEVKALEKEVKMFYQQEIVNLWDIDEYLYVNMSSKEMNCPISIMVKKLINISKDYKMVVLPADMDQTLILALGYEIGKRANEISFAKYIF